MAELPTDSGWNGSKERVEICPEPDRSNSIGAAAAAASRPRHVFEELEDSRKMHYFGINFAPIFAPLERRLQTLAAATWISCFLFFPTIVSIFLVACLFSDSWFKWIPVLYVTWFIYDLDTPHRGGRSNRRLKRWFRNSVLWRYFRDFFPVKLVKTTDLDPKRSYLFGNHPHGILCSGAFTAFGTDALNFERVFPGFERHILTIRGQFWLPGYRDLFLLTGACSATKQSMEHLFSKKEGQISVLIVGGALEALEVCQNATRLVLNRRKGFVKLALRFGVDLVPTFSFGEQFVYNQIRAGEGSWLKMFQKLAEKLSGFAPALFYGRGMFQYNFGVLPHRNPITVVTGSPIRVDKVENPTVEQIAELHQKYVEALTELYAEYNPIYGDPNVDLFIS